MINTGNSGEEKEPKDKGGKKPSKNSDSKKGDRKEEFVSKLKKGYSPWVQVGPGYDWKKEYNQVFRRWTDKGPDLTKALFDSLGLSTFSNDNPALEMVSGIYLVWGYKGAGKTTRLSMGLPLEGDDAVEPFISKAGREELAPGGVFFCRMSEPDYATDLLFAAELTSLIRLVSAKTNAFILIDSMSAVLNYQAKHSAAEGEMYSGELVSLTDRYIQKPFDLMATNAAGAGGVPGSLGHLLRVLQNAAKSTNNVLVGLMNPLKLGESQSESSLIREINSITNGVLPLDGCVVSEDVRMYDSVRRIASRVSFHPEHETAEMNVNLNPLDAKYKL